MLKEAQFYSKLLKLDYQWDVSEVEFVEAKGEIHLYICYTSQEYVDTKTGEVFEIYDLRPDRVWRHLDTMQYPTYIHCRIPRIRTGEGKVESVPVNWAESDCRHTHLFENKTIQALQATHNQTQCAQIMGVTQEKVNYMMHRAVGRGLLRRSLDEQGITQICLDEKSYGKGHKYVTILSDPVRGRVLDVSKGRNLNSVDEVLKSSLQEQTLTRIKEVCCDMWEAYTTGLKKIVRTPSLYTINSML
jgi:transposase